MAVFRVNKKTNYTVLTNIHFKDATLSWKAKGLLSNILSLPEQWDYSLEGLTKLASDGESSTRTALKELEEHGYLRRRPIRINGRFVDWEYIVFESPVVENPQAEKPSAVFSVVENPQVKNQGQ